MTDDGMLGVWVQGEVVNFGSDDPVLNDAIWDIMPPDREEMDLQTALALFRDEKVKITIEVIKEFS